MRAIGFACTLLRKFKIPFGNASYSRQGYVAYLAENWLKYVILRLLRAIRQECIDTEEMAVMPKKFTVRERAMTLGWHPNRRPEASDMTYRILFLFRNP